MKHTSHTRLESEINTHQKGEVGLATRRVVHACRVKCVTVVLLEADGVIVTL